MSYKIIKNYVNKSKYQTKCPYHMEPRYITVHNTDNDAPAENEVAYMRRNNLQTSFHVAIDDKHVVYGVPLSRNAWHAGDGNGTGNRKSIGVEICYSKSGGKRFDEAEKNAVKWIARELKSRGWGIDRVKRHKDWSGKNCPKRTMSRGWQRFLDMVKSEMRGTAPAKPIKPTKLKVDGYFGESTIKASQRKFKIEANGRVYRQPIANKKYLVRATEDWKFTKNIGEGSLVIKKMQKLFDVKVDGYFGQGSVKGMQKYLNKKGYELKVDGYMGESTVKAWQKYLNK